MPPLAWLAIEPKDLGVGLNVGVFLLTQIPIQKQTTPGHNQLAGRWAARRGVVDVRCERIVVDQVAESRRDIHPPLALT